MNKHEQKRQTESRKAIEMQKVQQKKKNKVLLSLSVTAVVALLAAGGILIANGLKANNSTTALQIADIQSDPLSFGGEITISGINAGIYPNDPKVFFVMDTAELIACKNMQCGAYRLPVIYKGDGPMPEIADEVDITGSWGKYEENGQEVDIFEVAQIDVKRNIMNLLGG